MTLNPDQCNAIKLAIQVMNSEVELLDQATRMNLGDNTTMIRKLDNAIRSLHEIVGE